MAGQGTVRRFKTLEERRSDRRAHVEALRAVPRWDLVPDERGRMVLAGTALPDMVDEPTEADRLRAAALVYMWALTGSRQARYHGDHRVSQGHWVTRVTAADKALRKAAGHTAAGRALASWLAGYCADQAHLLSRGEQGADHWAMP